MPLPLTTMFLTNHNGLNNLGRGSPKEHFCKIIVSFQLKNLFLAPVTWYAMDRNNMNNFERGPTKDHSCEVWSKSNQWFRRRCSLKKLFTHTWMHERMHAQMHDRRTKVITKAHLVTT